jgi:hypothetical protein
VQQALQPADLTAAEQVPTQPVAVVVPVMYVSLVQLQPTGSSLPVAAVAADVVAAKAALPLPADQAAMEMAMAVMEQVRQP